MPDRKKRKEKRVFYLSVEGVNCEKQYFEHLQKLINQSSQARYGVEFVIKAQISPKSMYKRISVLPVDRYGRNQKIPYLHIQDIEDYKNTEARRKFEGTLDDMRWVRRQSGVPYELGYSNYTFELWMLLHVTDMTGPLSSRKQYLKPINQYFDRNYQTLDQYKETGEFEKILQEFVTLDSVRAAIRQAEKLRMRKQENGIKWTEYSGFRFYKDNPDTTVDQVVRIIFEACGIPLV